MQVLALRFSCLPLFLPRLQRARVELERIQKVGKENKYIKQLACTKEKNVLQLFKPGESLRRGMYHYKCLEKAEYLIPPLIKGVRNSKSISQAQNTPWSWGTHCHRTPSVTDAQRMFKAQLNTFLEQNSSRALEVPHHCLSEIMGHSLSQKKYHEHYGKTMNLTYPLWSRQNLFWYHINKPTCHGRLAIPCIASLLSLSVHLPPPLHLPHQQCHVSGCDLHGISTPTGPIIILSYWYYVNCNMTNHRQIGRS